MLPFVGSLMIANTSAAAGGSIVPCSYNGSFTSAGSSSTVTSPLLTATVDGSNSGGIQFLNFDVTGSVTLQIDDDGAGFVTISEGHEITQANGDTLQVRAIGVASSEAISFDIVDKDTGHVIESAILYYNSGRPSGGGGGISP